jgi:hypothetical protein
MVEFQKIFIFCLGVLGPLVLNTKVELEVLEAGGRNYSLEMKERRSWSRQGTDRKNLRLQCDMEKAQRGRPEGLEQAI